MRWIGAVSMTLLLLAGAPVAGATKPATLTGTLAGAKLPAAGKGVVPVLAVNLRDGRVAAAAYATAKGRFTLKAPAGTYVVMASVVRPRGSGKPVEGVAAVVRVKAGKRIGLGRTKLKAPKRGKASRQAPAARAAFQHVSYMALWIKRWQAPPGELSLLARGLTDMLMGDLGPAVARCGGAIVDRDAWPILLAEQARQQSPRFDPASRVQTGRLIVPNATVSGRITLSGSTMTLTATFRDERSGRSGTASVSGPADAFFDNEQQLVTKLEKLICDATPKTYEGTFTGTATSELNQYTITWSGSVTIALQDEHGFAPDGWPPGDYAQYVVKRGSVHVKLDGTRGVCGAHGETDIDLAAAPATPPPGIPGFSGPGIPTPPALPVAAVERNPREDGASAFSLNLPARPEAVIPYQETGFGCQVNPEYPLTAIPFVYTPAAIRATRGVLTGSPSWDRDQFSHFQFGFSLRPAT